MKLRKKKSKRGGRILRKKEVGQGALHEIEIQVPKCFQKLDTTSIRPGHRTSERTLTPHLISVNNCLSQPRNLVMEEDPKLKLKLIDNVRYKSFKGTCGR